MIRKNKNQHVPLYREVVRESLRSAWDKRRLWIFAIFAAILQTGGTLDVILYSVKQMTLQGSSILQSPWINILSTQTLLRGTSDLHNVFAVIGRVQAFMYVALIIGGILVCSLLAQGALVYGLNARLQGKTARLRECLSVSGKHIWSIAALNILTIGLIWLARFILVVPFAYSVRDANVGAVILYIGSFALYLLTTFLFTTIHLFALNALTLEGRTIWQSIEHSYGLFKRSWLIILETGLIMLAIGFAILFAAIVLFFVGVVPLALFMIGGALVQSVSLLTLGYALSLLLFLAIMITAGAFTVTFQYDTWGRLYQRIQEGTALAKLHRWYHAIKHHE